MMEFTISIISSSYTLTILVMSIFIVLFLVPVHKLYSVYCSFLRNEDVDTTTTMTISSTPQPQGCGTAGGPLINGSPHSLSDSGHFEELSPEPSLSRSQVAGPILILAHVFMAGLRKDVCISLSTLPTGSPRISNFPKFMHISIYAFICLCTR